MAAEHWFRSHHGAPTDPKWLAVAVRAKTQPGVVAATWWAIMDHASQNTPRGSAEGFDAEAVAAFFGWDEAVIAAVIEALRAKGMIGPDGMLAAWDKRQPKREDVTATERKRKQREREAESVTIADVTPCHETSRAVPLETETEERQKERNSAANAAGGAAPADEPATDPTAARAEAFGLLKATWPGGKLPRSLSRDEFGEPWTPAREGSIWNNLAANDPPADVNAAIRVAIAKNPGQPFTLRTFQSAEPNCQEFYHQCLAEGRRKRGRGLRPLQVVPGAA